MLSRLPQALSLLLLVTCIDAAPGVADYRHHAARSPQQAPANPPRNKTIFTAQICGLVGGYIATVLIWGILLLTVGRRMRKRTQESPKALELEIVTSRPSGRALASPLSARSATSWFKKGFKKNESIRDSAVGSPESPAIQSPNSFDQKVIEADRDRAQAEMERLYAAVMEHDRKKSFSQASNAGDDVVEVADKRPSRIDTNVSRDTTTHSNPASPMRAIYPPGYHNGPPTAPLPRDRSRDQNPPASPRSILSKKSHMSTTSNSSRARFNLKNLRISGPIQKYPSNGSDDEEARTPLSPRFYNPGLPPSPPSQMNTPTTPGDLEEAYEQLDEPQPLPRPAPQRLGSYNSYSQSPTSSTTPTHQQPGLPSKSANSSAHELPLRGYSEPLKSPDLRTTVLDRKKDKLAMAAARTPGTAPGTGVPFTPYTPYSPYMPFTPVTPVTPHLVTKSDRKNLKKAYGRRMAAREQLVQTPKEIFGDAY